MTFAERLTMLRKNAHLTQQQLSRRSGVTQQGISLLEKGKTQPSFYTVSQLARGLRVPVETLISEETKKPTAEGDGLMSDIINQVQTLSEPALVRLSDFLSGLAAGQEITLQQQADPDPASGSVGPDPPDSPPQPVPQQ